MKLFRNLAISLVPNDEYPQTWHLVARLRVVWLIRFTQLLCGWLIGHELSETEWCYGGGGYVDRNCRWCDKVFRVPKETIQESHPDSYGMIEDFDEQHQHH